MKRTVKIALLVCLISLVSTLMFTACNTPPPSPPPSHEHTVAIYEAVAPTYYKAGLTAGAYCSECGEVLVAQKLVPATGSVGLTYTRWNGTCTITGIGTCTDTNICVPRRMDDHKVTGIGDSAFANCSNLVSVSLPDSVTTIGKWAFSYCNNLTSVTLSNGVITVGRSAFANCPNLMSVTIGDSVTTINDNIFWKCTNLKSIQFEGTVDEWNAIRKDKNWDASSGNYTIYCIDGTIDKNGTVTK